MSARPSCLEGVIWPITNPACMMFSRWLPYCDLRGSYLRVSTAGHKIDLERFTSWFILPVRVRLDALVVDAKALRTHVALAVDQRAVGVVGAGQPVTRSCLEASSGELSRLNSLLPGAAF